jgi:hypothetical protein
MAEVITLSIEMVGYNIHEKAEMLIRAATEPTIVEMIFTGGNTYRKYSPQCLDDTPEVAVEMFTNMVKTHDWYYEYSDDHRVWRQGQNAYDDIHLALKKLTARGLEVQKIYDEVCPFGK